MLQGLGGCPTVSKSSPKVCAGDLAIHSTRLLLFEAQHFESNLHALLYRMLMVSAFRRAGSA